MTRDAFRNSPPVNDRGLNVARIIDRGRIAYRGQSVAKSPISPFARLSAMP